MALTREDVLKVAKLSMLEFKESEVMTLQNELNDILEFVSKLDEANVEGVVPMTQVNEMYNSFREDVVRESLTKEEAIKNAPEEVEGSFAVPRTVSGN
ncbi:MAG: Asp-tRNA(Asn)/Glu-tRNA(Gln) amidotransferase subunit GatC [Psychrilyobacter sp.]|uniref:Asp-tRNA(Asn)/Glu-tRNA(Gln) amidotransferase subunit GatC n=1 Tax=Psychrilyobacter sp. TaxID=2586924 RepID=UPI003C74B90A